MDNQEYRNKNKLELTFWNINGMKNLYHITGSEYKQYLNNSIIIGLSETWLVNKNIFLPKGSSTWITFAVKLPKQTAWVAPVVVFA